MYECPSCASNWVDTETFTTMCSNREERGAVAVILGSTREAAPLLAGPIRYLPCPVCAKLMNRTNFGHRSGVVIDVCKGHGAWFQPRELRSVLLFVDSGGFEKARVEESRQRDEERLKLERAFKEGGASAPAPAFSFKTMAARPGGMTDSLLKQLLEGLLS
jgi:Zn-finger nucleic acid-binding protein